MLFLFKVVLLTEDNNLIFGSWLIQRQNLQTFGENKSFFSAYDKKFYSRTAKKL